jgi:antitoxin component of MazEF toxin-antitoxin module
VIVKVRKIGRDLVVVIPRQIARVAGLAESSPVELVTSGNVAVIFRKQSRGRRPMSGIVKQMDRQAYRRLRNELEW